MKTPMPRFAFLLMLVSFGASAQEVPRVFPAGPGAVDRVGQAPMPTPSAAPAAAIPGTTASVTRSGERHTLNLKAADINVLISTVAEITGRSFIVDPRVEGRVTVISERPLDADEIYRTFEAVLRTHGFAVMRSGGIDRIVPDVIAAREAPYEAATSDSLVTRVIQVKHVSALELVALLRPLLAPEAQLTAHADSNSLLISDRAANAERIGRIVARIDTAADAEVEVIPLRHANASEVARTLGMLAAPPAPGMQASSTRLVADTRTNSVLLSGSRADRLRLRTLAAHLDTPLAGGDNTRVVYLNYASAEDLVPILQGVAATLTGIEAGQPGAQASIIAHGETNAVVISAAPAVYRELQGVIRQLDIRRAQVLVEAIIAEVSDDLADELGVQWQSTNYDGTGSGYLGGTNFPSTGNAGIVGALTNPLGAVGGSGLNLGYIGGRVTLPVGPNGEEVTVFQVGALVKALRGDGRANVLSQPSIVTLDHHEAEITVAQEVPFLTGSYANTSTGGGTNQPTNPFQTVERKDVGLILTVTPHVNEGDSVRLDIRQEVSAIAASSAGAVDLITNKRELRTSVLVADGGLLVLGGLSSDEVRQNTQGVPGISRVPLLGNLFKSRNSSKARRQLMVFLRPTILRDAAVESAVSGERYNLLRNEQQRLRDNQEMRYRGEQQPLLPALPADDLMQRPPPVQQD